MRTYSKSEFLEAREAWAEGEFSEEWDPFRRLAADLGFIYPPTGSRWDSWDDDEPSQRAVLIRAIRETPDALRTAMLRSRSWYQVVDKLLATRDGMRDDVDLRDRDDAWDRRNDLDARQATLCLGEIISRISDSVARRGAA